MQAFSSRPRGRSELSERAVAILTNSALRFVSTLFVQLVVLPKALYHNKRDEVALYNLYFRQVTIWVPVTEALMQAAHREAVRSGLPAVDALHVASAAAGGADELVTTEAPGKPLHRTKLVPVRTLHLE
jgi:predicted nucleic acid-binding protein